MQKKIRNIAIIAHVDHGKTTMVDTLFQQSGVFREGQHVEVRAMDSNAIEKERGITILSKCTSISWKDHTINILDTPGHSDFGSEVERVLMMAEGVLLIVDAVEGVMPQTKFVVTKALQNKLKLIIFINKIDRVNADNYEELEPVVKHALNEVMDLVFEIYPDAIDSPVFYGSGRGGYASSNLRNAYEGKVTNIHEILDKILHYIPAPVEKSDKLQLLTSMVDIDEYFGKLLIGKVFSGHIKTGQNVISIQQDGSKREDFRVNKLFGFAGIKKFEKLEAGYGEIVCIAGADESSVGDMLATDINTSIIKAPHIDPPTLSVVISANTSPLKGQDGKLVTIREIKNRLWREAETNVGINVEENGETMTVKGRGELQLSVLMEQMRRDGFEFIVSAPKILLKEEHGKKLEPQEKVFIDVNPEFSSIVINKVGTRGGELMDMKEFSTHIRLIFQIPARFLLGYFSEFMSDTKGTGILNKEFDGYIPYKGDKRLRSCGVLISMAEGKTTSYAMDKLQDRGVFFIEPDTITYPGMIIGEHNRDNDLEVNAVKAKQLTNVRASGKDDMVRLPPPIRMTLEKAITYIIDGESVEVTPKRICLIKNKI
jgi:GTP-binding protein